MLNKAVDEANSGYSQVGGSSSSLGGQVDSERSPSVRDVNDRGQGAKRGKDHSAEKARCKEKRVRRDDFAMRETEEAALDRIASEHSISDLRKQATGGEATIKGCADPRV